MIYMGPADKALNFFVHSPSLGLSLNDYSSPADFLSDVSGCRMRNDQVDNTLTAPHYAVN
jgi:hypothetical protein